MIARDRLCLTSDRRRVVSQAHPDARYLLAAQGQEIEKEFEPLVRDYYGQKESVPETQTEPPAPATVMTSIDQIEARETRIVTNLRRRGRPRKNPEGESA